jgi:hypothetical protein
VTAAAESPRPAFAPFEHLGFPDVLGRDFLMACSHAEAHIPFKMTVEKLVVLVGGAYDRGPQ